MNELFQSASKLVFFLPADPDFALNQDCDYFGSGRLKIH